MGLLPTGSQDSLFSPRCVWVNGPIIIGAGLSAGLAVAACLREHGVPFVVLEAADCITSANLPNQLLELPRMPFPDEYPKYITRRHFYDYLEHYASTFDIKPEFNNTVCSVRYDVTSGLWRVHVVVSGANDLEYISRWLVAACKNTEPVVPYIPGLADFDGDVTHVSAYKSSESYRGKRVLVVGCGRSGTEVSMDLCDHGARPFMVVRDAVHVVPRELLGKLTSDLALLLLRWLPLWLVNKVMDFCAWLVLGNLRKFGFCSLASKTLGRNGIHARTMFLDRTTAAHIRAGDIDIVPAVVRFRNGQVQLIDGRIIDVDAALLATGYRSSNAPQWLSGNALFDKDGYPSEKESLSAERWKGKAGLYAIGFMDNELMGAWDHVRAIAEDLARVWREETKPTKRAGGCHRRCMSVVF